jgi:outer membrane protein
MTIPANPRFRVERWLARGLGLLLFAAATAAVAEERGENRERIEPHGYIYGGALGVRREIYTDYDRRVIPLPVIGYRGERLQVFGPFVNYELYRAGAFAFDARLSPRFAGFDESDSDIFDGMEEREFSMDLGVGLTWQRDDWKIELAGLHDVLERSDGREWRANLGRAYRVGKVFLEPSIGVSYLDRRHVDYYYGVDETEATSFRPAYRGDSALNRTLGIDLVTPAWFDGFTRIGIENTWYDSAIADSPLTDTDSSLRVFIAFSKFFKP